MAWCMCDYIFTETLTEAIVGDNLSELKDPNIYCKCDYLCTYVCKKVMQFCNVESTFLFMPHYTVFMLMESYMPHGLDFS